MTGTASSSTTQAPKSPTSRLFDTLLSSQLELFHTKVQAVSSGKTVYLKELRIETSSSPAKEIVFDLLGEVYQHWTKQMDIRDIELFKTTCFKIGLLEMNFEPIRENFKRTTKHAINEFIEDMCSYIKTCWNGSIHFSFLMKNYLSIKFAISFASLDFAPDESDTKVTESTTTSPTSKIMFEDYQIKTEVLENIKLINFQNLDVTQTFQIPVDDVGQKECHFSIIVTHWLRPLMKYLHSSGLQQPTKRTELNTSKGWVEPDFHVEMEKSSFSVELKCFKMSNFLNGKICQLDTLVQVTKYLEAYADDLNFLVSPDLLARVRLDAPSESEKSEGVVVNAEKPSCYLALKVDVFNHETNERGGLIAALLCMLTEQPPKKLDDQEVNRLGVAIENLKLELREQKQERENQLNKDPDTSKKRQRTT